MCTLGNIGWIPVSPSKWIDHRGNRWMYSGKGSLGCMYAAIREAVEYKVWDKAASHYCGKGVERGIDMVPIHKMVKYMSKKGENLGKLYAILAGGVWPEARKHQAGLTSSALCPHCGKEDQDLYHLYWGCDVVW